MPLPSSGRKRSLGFVLFLFVSIIVLVATIGWLITFDWRVLRPSVTAKIGTVETAYSAIGIALREEVVLNAPLSGQVDQLVSEGVRVPANTVIAIINDNDYVKLLTREQNLLQRRLDDILTRNPLNKPTEINDAEAANALAAEEKTIRQRLAEIAEELKACRIEIVTPTAGEVAYYVDGLESPGPLVAIDNLLKLPQPLASFPRVPTKPLPTLHKRMIEAGKPLAKVIDTLQFWVVADLPSEASVSVGQKIKVGFVGDGRELLDAKVEKVVAAHPEFLRVVLLFQDYQPFFSKQRWTELKVVTQYHEGVRIPVRALKQTNSGYQVNVKGFGGVVAKPVRVISQDAEYAIVDGLAVGTRVIL